MVGPEGKCANSNESLERIRCAPMLHNFPIFDSIDVHTFNADRLICWFYSQESTQVGASCDDTRCHEIVLCNLGDHGNVEIGIGRSHRANMLLCAFHIGGRDEFCNALKVSGIRCGAH